VVRCRNLVARPGTEAPGRILHLGADRVHGRTTLSLDAYRNGAALRADDLALRHPRKPWRRPSPGPANGSSRTTSYDRQQQCWVFGQGRVRYFVDGGPFEVHLEYTDLHQIGSGNAR